MKLEWHRLARLDGGIVCHGNEERGFRWYGT